MNGALTRGSYVVVCCCFCAARSNTKIVLPPSPAFAVQHIPRYCLENSVFANKQNCFALCVVTCNGSRQHARRPRWNAWNFQQESEF